MSRPADHKTAKKNPTEERLRATPFDNVEELDQEKRNIRMAVWRRITEGQIVDEFLTKNEGRHLREEWAAGLICFLDGNSPKDNIYKIFSEGKGLKLQLNPAFTKSLAENEVKFLEGVVRAGIEGYGALYMRTKSVLPNPEASAEPKPSAVRPRRQS